MLLLSDDDCLITTPAASRNHADSGKLRSPVHQRFLSQTSYADISFDIPQCSSHHSVRRPTLWRDASGSKGKAEVMTRMEVKEE